MRSDLQEQLAAEVVGVSCDPFAHVYSGAHLGDTSSFDTKVQGMVQNGPIIPCERRLRKTEISEFEEVNSETRFGNRDYERPYRHISVTLRGFD